VWALIGYELPTPIARMTYHDAMERYGSDKPDLRFGCELVDLTDYFKDTTFRVFQNPYVGAVVMPGGASQSRRTFDAWQEWAKQRGAKGLAYVTVAEDGTLGGPVAKNITDAERDQMYAWYAPEERMRANIGIRRRLAPLLDASRAEVELAYALLLSLPGSPCLYYGDEIGMGENIWLEDRDAVRTPMQWDDSPNMGFSTVVDPGALTLPLIQAPGYAHLTVATEMARPDSLLQFTRRILHLRRAHPVLGRGNFLLRPTSDDAVLAHTRCDESSVEGAETLLCVSNLSATPRSVTIEVPELAGRGTTDLFGGCAFPPVDEQGRLTLTLGARGYYWLSVDRTEPDDAPQGDHDNHPTEEV